MNRLRINTRWPVLIIMLALLSLLTGTARGAPFTSPSWQIVSSPDPGTNGNDLHAVAANSSSDVWTVGYYYSQSLGPFNTLIEHWNGTTWNVISSPNIGTSFSTLSGVAAVSSNNVWAVGDYGNSASGPVYTLVEHWNGMTWTIVPSPNVAGSNSNALTAVAAISATNIWAIGSYHLNNNIAQTLIEHWNGTSWTIIPSPNANSNNNFLNAVAAVSANNVWAVGAYYTDNNISNTLIEQWNGTSWVIVPSPSPGPYGSALTSVTAVSLNNVWAVGAYTNFTNDVNVSQTLTERWNGTSWNITPSPNIGRSRNSLNAVSAVSANNIWAAGQYLDIKTVMNMTLIEHWDGTSWSTVSSPNAAGAHYDVLEALVAISSKDIWAIGINDNSNYVDQTLTEFCC